MTEPTKEQIDTWREKFKKLSFYKVNGISMPLNTAINESGQFESVSTDFIWMGYLAAKRSDFEEIKTLKEQLAEAVELLRKNGSSCVYTVMGIDFKGCDCWHHSRQRFLEKQGKENKD